MNVRLEFYAQLRDIARISQLTIDIPPNSTVADLLEALYRSQPSLRSHDKTILVGSGVEFVDRGHVVQPGEIISIMPPVQGG